MQDVYYGDVNIAAMSLMSNSNHGDVVESPH
jgi:hypothetical protein